MHVRVHGAEPAGLVGNVLGLIDAHHFGQRLPHPLIFRNERGQRLLMLLVRPIPVGLTPDNQSLFDVIIASPPRTAMALADRTFDHSAS